MHNVFRKTLVLSSLFIILFSLISITFADTAVLTYERLWPLKARLTGPDGFNFQVPSNKKLLDGQIAFCLEPLLEVVNGGTYTAHEQFPGISAATIEQLERIVYIGWERSAKTAEDYFATSLKVWEALGYRVTSTTGFDVKSYSTRSQQIDAAIDDLIRLPSFHGQSVLLTKGDSLVLTDKNQVFSDMFASAGTKPTAVSFKATGNDLSLSALKAGTDTLIFQKVPDSYVGTSIFWETPTAGKQNLATLKLRTSIQASVQVQVTEPTGTITVTKMSTTNSPLQGVEITLYDASKQKIISAISGADGKVNFTQRVYGDYYIQESRALPGYVPDTQFKAVTLASDQAALTITNAPIQVEFEKIDRASGQPLTGAHFELQQSGKVIKAWTSTQDPQRFSALPAGTYQVVEKDAPPAYLLMEPVTIQVKESSEVQKFTLANDPVRGVVTILKTDRADQTALAGAVISLYREDGTLIDERISDANGQVQFEGLGAGSYYFVEKEAPDGYARKEQTFPFAIDRDHLTQQFKLENDRIYGQPVITKRDISTQEPLPDTLIAIFHVDGTLLEEKRTDQVGEASFTPLPAGSYYFLEREAPYGYQLNADPHPFTITEQGQIVKGVLEDERILVSPAISKVDFSTRAPLPDTRIALYREDGTLVEEKVTDKEGLVTFTPLPVGNYYFLESGAPVGYNLNPEKQPFTVSEQGQIIRCTLEDHRIEADLRIRKIDATTKMPLAGAVFELYQNGELLHKLTSDESGQTVIRLPYGAYELKEFTPPLGYDKTEQVYSFDVKEQDNTVELVIENTRTTAKLPRTGVSHASLLFGTLSVALGLSIQRHRQ